MGLAEIAEETARRHTDAFGDAQVYKTALDVGGEYAYRTRGEDHAWTAESVSTLQHAVARQFAGALPGVRKDPQRAVERLLTLRGLFRIKTADDEKRKPVKLDQVEPAAEIVKRFATGAMSFGSISREAHTTAIAMNRIGGKSNTGEGGEESDRFKPLPNGDSMRSAIKQVASGRFGVTTEYLVNSDMMQIKMAQGAKPGEGGQLPGHKVDATIARVRHSTPGVGLISPPPHRHLFDRGSGAADLRPQERQSDGQVSVKLVPKSASARWPQALQGAPTMSPSRASRAAPARPLTSIKHAGSPWEIGLAETPDAGARAAAQPHRGPGRRRLPHRRDVVIGALLGADEFGFATAPLIAAGCIMMRKCHLNTCPVGVATQDPVLRKRFTGQPEHVINYFFFVAEEVREIMAQLGYKKFDEMVGQVDARQSTLVALEGQGLDFSKLFVRQKEEKARRSIAEAQTIIWRRCSTAA